MISSISLEKLDVISMGKIISVVGVSGVGKTTLVKALSAQRTFQVAFEDHAERPYQSGFKKDKSLAFHNQVDYLLHKAEQELLLRKSNLSGLIDGGLDQDYYVFCTLFLQKGWLSLDEYKILERIYQLIRSFQPLPELFIRVVAEPLVIKKRLAKRERINIASSEDIGPLDDLIDGWLSTNDPSHILTIDTTQDDDQYSMTIPIILAQLNKLSL